MKISSVPQDIKPVGLLFDSISRNTGDKAIGIALKDYLEAQKITYEIVNPFDFRIEDYDFLIIGGGYILRDPGNQYYDLFRAAGPHVLNGVGCSTTKELQYLDSYKKVTVRSEADRKRLLKSQSNKSVFVVPDVTTILIPADIPESLIPEGSIGIHIVADTLNDCEDLQLILNDINEHKVMIPFTHYNYDRRLMIKMNLQGDYQFLDELEPKELFAVIGKMKYVIVSSLHATIFAYVQNVPFLSFYQEKVHEYLTDRGLEHLMFKNSSELLEKLSILQDGSLDFKEHIKKDKKAVKEHLDDIISSQLKLKVKPNQLAKTVLAKYDEDSLIIDLHEDVLAHRDELIHTLIVRNEKLRESNTSQEDHIRSLITQRDDLQLIVDKPPFNRAIDYIDKKYNSLISEEMKDSSGTSKPETDS